MSQALLQHLILFLLLLQVLDNLRQRKSEFLLLRVHLFFLILDNVEFALELLLLLLYELFLLIMAVLKLVSLRSQLDLVVLDLLVLGFIFLLQDGKLFLDEFH